MHGHPPLEQTSDGGVAFQLGEGYYRLSHGTLVREPLSTATALEAIQGQMDGFFSQLPYKCHLEEVVYVED